MTVSGSNSAIRDPQSAFLKPGQAQEQQFPAFFRQATAHEAFRHQKRSAGKNDRRRSSMGATVPETRPGPCGERSGGGVVGTPSYSPKKELDTGCLSGASCSGDRQERASATLVAAPLKPFRGRAFPHGLQDCFRDRSVAAPLNPVADSRSSFGLLVLRSRSDQ